MRTSRGCRPEPNPARRRIPMAQDREMDASKDDGRSAARLTLLSRIRETWRSLNRLRHGIGLRLLVGVLLFSSAITLILTLFQLYLDYRQEFGAIESRMSEIERSYLQSLSEGLWNLDRRQLELQVEGILRLPAVRFVAVRETTASANPRLAAAGTHQDHAAVSTEFPLFHTPRGNDQPLCVVS